MLSKFRIVSFGEKIYHHSGEIGGLIQNCSKLFCINLFGSGVQQAVLICCYIFVIVRYLERARNVINHHLESRTINFTTSQDPRKYNACSLKWWFYHLPIKNVFHWHQIGHFAEVSGHTKFIFSFKFWQIVHKYAKIMWIWSSV